jgi:hypothetical protein
VRQSLRVALSAADFRRVPRFGARVAKSRVRSKPGVLFRQTRRIAADRRAATLKRVKRNSAALGFCLSAAMLLGCGQSSLNTPKPAPQADAETRVVPQKQPRELPRLIAPPPKYGNKIVMAQASAAARQN